MNKFQKSLASAVAAGALLLNGLMPVLGATTIVISGNGSDSYNKADVDLQSTTNVQQSNNADVYNNVDVDASTGDNDAKDNTGGEVAIETGDADVNVEVSNVLNSNSAEVDCCPGGDVDVLIDNNGSDSKNKVYLDMNSGGENNANVAVRQANNAQVKNIVDAEAETGDNDADDNIGGDVSIKTGDADTSVKLSTAANTNSAKVGGNGQGSSLSAIISGNGTDTYNKIDLDLESATWFLQSNFADIYNDVDAEAETGDNDAKDNTGGEVAITTGDADTDVTVDNMVNFNWAEGDCGCLYEDLLVKIVDNGSDTTNKIEALLASELGVLQDNCTKEGSPLKDCEIDNFVDADADSGDNKVEDSTDGDDNDPSIETGDADATVELENSGNSNVYGSTPDWEFPDFDLDLHFSFDLNDLLDWLMG